MATRAPAGVGQRYYDEVREVLRAQGGTTRAAFEVVAQRHGATLGNVQTAYYRHARNDPSSGVNFRPRANRKRSTRAVEREVERRTTIANGVAARHARTSTSSEQPGDVLRALAADLRRSAALLEHEAKLLDSERATLDRIRGVVNGAGAKRG